MMSSGLRPSSLGLCSHMLIQWRTLWVRCYTLRTEAQPRAWIPLFPGLQPCLALMTLRLQDGGKQQAESGIS